MVVGYDMRFLSEDFAGSGEVPRAMASVFWRPRRADAVLSYNIRRAAGASGSPPATTPTDNGTSCRLWRCRSPSSLVP